MAAVRKNRLEIYRCSTFFTADFAFSFRRMQHSASDYNEKVLHQREFWKIIYLVAGQGQKIINEVRYPLNPGGLFLIHPQDRTSFIIESPYIKICNILFLPELIRDGLRDLNDDFSFFSILQQNFNREAVPRAQLYIAGTDRNIDHLVKNLEAEYNKKSPNYRALIKLNLLELLIRLCRKAKNRRRGEGRDDIVSYINHLIDHHFRSEFNLDFLATQLQMSKSHLCRLYRARTGGTVMDTLRNRRLHEAGTLLATQPSCNISHICYACGFNDLSYFYRAFTAAFGKNPGDYRRSFGLD